MRKYIHGERHGCMSVNIMSLSKCFLSAYGTCENDRQILPKIWKSFESSALTGVYE